MKRILLWRQLKCLRNKTERTNECKKKKNNTHIEKKKRNRKFILHSTQYLRDPHTEIKKKHNKLAGLQSCGSFMGAWTTKIFHLKAIKMCVYLTSTTVFFYFFCCCLCATFRIAGNFVSIGSQNMYNRKWIVCVYVPFRWRNALKIKAL